MVLGSLVISGGIAATAGWIQLGHVGSASTGISATFLLPALTAGFLGATSIKVGRFNVAGTVLAVVLAAIGVLGAGAEWCPQLGDTALRWSGPLGCRGCFPALGKGSRGSVGKSHGLYARGAH